MALNLMYITNSPDVALVAEKNGVDRVWIDLETLGKEERQCNMNTVKSHHTIDDIRRIKPLLTKSELLVRVNPWNDNSEQEINGVIDAGADMIMLPMWKSAEEVNEFLRTVNKRCKTTLLLETKEAHECLDEVLKNGGMDEIHIGLNDLHLSYGMDFMFELLANGMVEEICKRISEAGLPYGFGGIARLGMGDLPAEKVIMEHYRIGSTRAILSRSFCNTDIVTDIEEINQIFSENMKELRCYENKVVQASEEQFSENQKEVKEIVAKIVQVKKESRR